MAASPQVLRFLLHNRRLSGFMRYGNRSFLNVFYCPGSPLFDAEFNMITFPFPRRFLPFCGYSDGKWYLKVARDFVVNVSGGKVTVEPNIVATPFGDIFLASKKDLDWSTTDISGPLVEHDLPGGSEFTMLLFFWLYIQTKENARNYAFGNVAYTDGELESDVVDERIGIQTVIPIFLKWRLVSAKRISSFSDVIPYSDLSIPPLEDIIDSDTRYIPDSGETMDNFDNFNLVRYRKLMSDVLSYTNPDNVVLQTLIRDWGRNFLSEMIAQTIGNDYLYAVVKTRVADGTEYAIVDEEGCFFPSTADGLLYVWPLFDFNTSGTIFNKRYIV